MQERFFCDFIQKRDLLFYVLEKKQSLNACYNCAIINYINVTYVKISFGYGWGN